MVTKIYKNFNVELSITDFFNKTKIIELAREVEIAVKVLEVQNIKKGKHKMEI